MIKQVVHDDYHINRRHTEQLNKLPVNEEIETLEDLPDELEDPKETYDDWNDEEYDFYPEEKDTTIIEIIRGMNICVIEEPLTCCDELPEIDHTSQYDKIVEDVIEYNLLVIEPEEKMYSEIE